MNFKPIRQVHQQLQLLNGIENPHSIEDFLVESDRNQLLIRENTEKSEIDSDSENISDIELRVCLKSELLKRLDGLELPKDFVISRLTDFTVLIEELSHFNTYCFRAMENREVSALELEVQGEVDKFGVILEWLYDRNELHLKEAVFDQLFGHFKLGGWVAPEETQRYLDAHQIAKNFCRGLLREDSGREAFRRKFKEFFSCPANLKLSPKH